ncbi:hypothetical protein EDC04DRAFT_2612511 [Pisolithus marmoratus]|nr:hypothetical protein EDC04DRAFT_2612511 [Pisolithus marmoratus]
MTMDYDPFEPFLPIIAALVGIIGQCCVEIVNQDMSSDNAGAQWNDDEKGTLITFLLEQKCAGKMGDGAFKPAIMNTAAVHLSQLFPNQRGLMKTGEHCKRQMSSICVYPDRLITDQLIVAIQLKTVLRDINQWHSMSGVHWDNVNRAKVGMEEEKQVFKTWLQDRPTNSMRHFENCGWPHFEGMEELYLNDQVHGSHMYHPASQAITISESTECGGVSTRSHVSSISSTPSSHICPSYPNSSSHASSDPIVTPSISSVPFWFVAPWVSSPSGTIAGGTSNDGFVEKPPNFIDVQPQALPLPCPLIPPLASPAVFSSSAPPMTTALQAISVEDNGERSLKRARKGKDQSTQVALTGVQGSLSYLGSIISSSLPAAAQQICTDKLQVALMTVDEWDKDLPIEAKAALIEAFHVDMGTIDLYMMLHDRDLCRCWMQCCLCYLKLVPENFML